ncbi:adhesion G-protein coupled receptor G5 isoform X2 [Macrotis lagotis]|uniref:adhesion G-protein coupled receptor G5 isoform X2 n=1 Tax=Macrotis lagotis TaxID=92651 RepID=UPI003D697F8F
MSFLISVQFILSPGKMGKTWRVNSNLRSPAITEQEKELLNYMKRLENSNRSRRIQDKQGSIHLLEAKLKEFNFSDDTATFQTNKIQSLIFKLTCNFPGLTINSVNLEKAHRRHVMQFPTELTQKACKARKGSKELRLICTYFEMEYFFQDDNGSLLLNNNILGASLVNHNVSSLRQNINIRFWYNQSLDRYNLTCVFWKEGAGKTSWGAWSTEGCKTIRVFPDQVLCHCNHLTYFAVLMKLSSVKISRELLAPLTYISIVGCSLSVVASLLTILLHFYSRKKSDSTTSIHMNLQVSVIFLNVTFLLSPSLTLQPVGCVAIGALLHYALLSCLTWMAIEGFNLYLLFVRVYNIYIQRYILKLSALGWGFPAFIVLLLLLSNSSTYGHYEIQIKTILENDTNSQNVSMCWIKSMKIHQIFVMGYTGVTSFFNLVILVWTVKIFYGLHSQEKKWKSQPCRDITTVLGLTLLLGITWNLAFFSFPPFLLLQLFFFTFFNSLYGFFLFLWFCAQKRHADLEAETSTSSQMTRIGLQSQDFPIRSPQPSSLTHFSSPFSPHSTSHQEGGIEEDMACLGT